MTNRAIVAVVDDVMFLSRLEQHIRALDYAFIAVDTGAELRTALADGVALAIVDLHVRGIEWRQAVSIAKERGLPVLAFGRHTEAQLLRDARAAGCERVVARSQIVEDLPKLVAALLSKDTEPISG